MPGTLDEIEQQYYSSSPFSQYADDIEAIYNKTEEGSRDRGRSAFLHGCILYDKRQAAEQYFVEAHKIAKYHRDDKMLSDSLHGLALIAFRNGDYRTTDRLEQEALTIAERVGHSIRVAVSYFMLGTIAKIYASFEDTAWFLNRALSLARENTFLKLEKVTLSKLSEVALVLGDLPKARTYALKSIEVAERIGIAKEIQLSILYLAAIELQMEEYDLVISQIDSLSSLQEITDPAMKVNMHHLLGSVYRKRNDLVFAETEFKKALDETHFANAAKVRSNIFASLAELYSYQNKYSKALEEANKSLEEAERSGHVAMKKDALRLLYDNYKAIGKYQEAYQYLEQYNTLIEKSDDELLRSRLEFHELKQDLELERASSEDRKREAELLRIELERKDQDLIEKTKHLLKQTESLAQFRNDLKAIVRRLPGDDPMAMEVRERLKSLPDELLNWQSFDEQFNSLHPQFLHNLTVAFPELTPQERKVCPLLRLNLETEEIAKLMFLSDRSVENHRYRIRKKLGLTTQQSLPDFLAKY